MGSVVDKAKAYLLAKTTNSLVSKTVTFSPYSNRIPLSSGNFKTCFVYTGEDDCVILFSKNDEQYLSAPTPSLFSSEKLPNQKEMFLLGTDPDDTREIQEKFLTEAAVLVLLNAFVETHLQTLSSHQQKTFARICPCVDFGITTDNRVYRIDKRVDVIDSIIDNRTIEPVLKRNRLHSDEENTIPSVSSEENENGDTPWYGNTFHTESTSFTTPQSTTAAFGTTNVPSVAKKNTLQTYYSPFKPDENSVDPAEDATVVTENAAYILTVSMYKLAKTIEFLNEKFRFLHRDLKPNNIGVLRYGRCDFDCFLMDIGESFAEIPIDAENMYSYGIPPEKGMQNNDILYFIFALSNTIHWRRLESSFPSHIQTMLHSISQYIVINSSKEDEDVENELLYPNEEAEKKLKSIVNKLAPGVRKDLSMLTSMAGKFNGRLGVDFAKALLYAGLISGAFSSCYIDILPKQSGDAFELHRQEKSIQAANKVTRKIVQLTKESCLQETIRWKRKYNKLFEDHTKAKSKIKVLENASKNMIKNSQTNNKSVRDETQNQLNVPLSV